MFSRDGYVSFGWEIQYFELLDLRVNDSLFKLSWLKCVLRRSRLIEWHALRLGTA